MKNLLPLFLLFFVHQALLSQNKLEPGLRRIQEQESRSQLVPNSILEQISSINRKKSASESDAATVFFPDTVYAFRISDTVRTIYSYDGRGNLTAMLNQPYSENEWINEERVTLAYGQAGNPDTLLLERWLDGAWVIEGREIYSYDQYGNNSMYRWERWINDQWEGSPGTRYSYTYDIHGNMLTKLQERYLDESWVLIRKFTYTYDALGQMKTSWKVNYGDSSWESEEIRHYTYDLDGNLLTELYEVLESGNWRKTSFTNYTYDSNGNRLLRLEKRWNDSSWEDSWKSTYFYDENDYLKETISEGNGYGFTEWRNRYRQTYINDPNGNLLVWEFFVWDTSTSSWGQTETEPVKLTVNGRDWWTSYAGIKIQFGWTPIEIEDNGPPTAAISYSDNEVSSLDNLEISATFTDPIDEEDTIKIILSGALTLTIDMQRKSDLVYTYEFQLPDTTGLVYVSLSNSSIPGRVISPGPSDGRFFIINPELAPAHRLDSTVSNTYKVEYEYDIYGRQTLYTSYFKDTSGMWIPSRTGDYIYDKLGNRVHIDTYTWDKVSNRWVDLYYSDRAYDVLGHGKELGYVRYYWDQDSSKWVGSYKYEFNYDFDGLKRSMSESYWSRYKGTWGTRYNYTYAYDEQGREKTELFTYWNDYSAKWDTISKYEYYYDESGKLSDEINFRWENNTKKWMEYSKYTSGYDQQGNEVLFIYYKWDTSASQWIGDYKYETMYDDHGNDTLYSRFYWEQLAGQWIESKRTKYTYDYAYGKKDFVLSNDWIAQNKILEGRKFHPEGEEWIENEVTLFYYSNSGCNYFNPETVSICEGESFSWHGQEHTISGVYYDSLLTTGGCDSIHKLDLVVHANPAPFVLDGLVSVYPDQTELYSATGNAEHTYYWGAENGSVLSNPASNSANIHWGVSGEGIILCVVENQFGCRSDTMKLNVTIGTTGFDGAHEGRIKIYPNPARDRIFIHLDEEAKVGLFDLHGRQVHAGEQVHGDASIDVEHLPSGSYILRIDYSESRRIDRLILIE